MRIFGQWMLVLTLVVTILGGVPADSVTAMPPAAPRAQSPAVTMVNPTSCPFAGCAAGQRLNMLFDFEPNGFDTSIAEDNVKVCLYAPTSWGVPVDSVAVEETGQLTGKPYTVGDPNCTDVDSPTPAGYIPIAVRTAHLEPNTFGDALSFGFRMGAAGAGSGRVVARLFAQSAPGTWTRVQQAASTPTLTITPAASPAYVGNDISVCGTANPCYINSGDDGVGGIGTGLKDAVDAAAPGSRIVVLSTYTIKSNTVAVNKPLTIAGSGESRITFSGPGACNAAMLSLNEAVTLRDLNITDGICTNPNRDLIETNSANTTAPVQIESNDLTGGKDAIVMKDNTGPVQVRFNAINSNSGYALRAQGVSAALEITANNLQSNGASPSVDCAEGASEAADNRTANHNYWGGGSPTEGNSHCTIDAKKRLGMAVLQESVAPGLRGRLVTVSEGKTYLSAFDSQIAYQRTGGGDFPLFIIDHGYNITGGPPFTYADGIESPSPCSNAWDVFLPDGVSGSGTLELFFKYDRTAGCQATINSNQYCDQTSDATDYPLFWLDPGASTVKWITTGSKIDSNTDGQPTSCNVGANEAHVSIDNSGRPGMEQDLGYTPFLVGVPIIKSFVPLASASTITVTWATNNEPDVVGFYIWRGVQGEALSPISDLITKTGSALVGKTYSVLDSGRVNGVSYSYRLQVLRVDGSSVYSSVVTVTANKATITPTPTITRTPTLRPTITPFPTYVWTRAPTRLPTSTRAVVRTPTRQATALVLATRTPTLDLRTPGMPQTATVLARTQQAAASATRTPTSNFPGSSTGEVDFGDGTTTPGATGTGGGTPVAMISGTPLTGTPSPTSTASPTSTSELGQPEGSASGTPQANPWTSLLLGVLAGLAAAGSVGGIWYFLRIRQ